MTGTYDGDIKHGHIKTNTGWTFGGYSGSETVHERFIVMIPDGFPLEAAGPVFCAGITMYSPLVHWKVFKTKYKYPVENRKCTFEFCCQIISDLQTLELHSSLCL